MSVNVLETASSLYSCSKGDCSGCCFKCKSEECVKAMLESASRCLRKGESSMSGEGDWT